MRKLPNKSSERTVTRRGHTVRAFAIGARAGPGGTCVENYEQWLDERMLDMALEELVHLGTDVDISSKNYWRELRSAARLLATSTMAQSLLPIIDKHDV